MDTYTAPVGLFSAGNAPVVPAAGGEADVHTLAIGPMVGIPALQLTSTAGAAAEPELLGVACTL